MARGEEGAGGRAVGWWMVGAGGVGGRAVVQGWKLVVGRALPGAVGAEAATGALLIQIHVADVAGDVGGAERCT